MQTGAPANPFAVRHHAPGAVDFIFEAARGAGSAAELLAQFARNRHRGELRGPHGTGKSTLLRALELCAQAHGHAVVRVAIRESDPQPFWIWKLDAWLARQTQPWPLPAAPSGWPRALVFVDGAELLGRAAWWSLRWQCHRQGLGLLATTHRSSGLPTLYRTQVGAELAQCVAAKVLAASPHTPRLVEAAEARQALAATHGDMREALFKLYDLYETRWGERHAVAAR